MQIGIAWFLMSSAWFSNSHWFQRCQRKSGIYEFSQIGMWHKRCQKGIRIYLLWFIKWKQTVRLEATRLQHLPVFLLCSSFGSAANRPKKKFKVPRTIRLIFLVSYVFVCIGVWKDEEKRKSRKWEKKFFYSFCKTEGTACGQQLKNWRILIVYPILDVL